MNRCRSDRPCRCQRASPGVFCRPVFYALDLLFFPFGIIVVVQLRAVTISLFPVCGIEISPNCFLLFGPLIRRLLVCCVLTQQIYGHGDLPAGRCGVMGKIGHPRIGDFLHCSGFAAYAVPFIRRQAIGAFFREVLPGCVVGISVLGSVFQLLLCRKLVLLCCVYLLFQHPKLFLIPCFLLLILAHVGSAFPDLRSQNAFRCQGFIFLFQLAEAV